MNCSVGCQLTSQEGIFFTEEDFYIRSYNIVISFSTHLVFCLLYLLRAQGGHTVMALLVLLHAHFNTTQ